MEEERGDSSLSVNGDDNYLNNLTEEEEKSPKPHESEDHGAEMLLLEERDNYAMPQDRVDPLSLRLEIRLDEVQFGKDAYYEIDNNSVEHPPRTPESENCENCDNSDLHSKCDNSGGNSSYSIPSLLILEKEEDQYDQYSPNQYVKSSDQFSHS